MNDQIKNILQDLYTIDPEFRKHEDRLSQIISELLASKPNVTIDESFAQDLRRRLQMKAMQMDSQQNMHYANTTVKRLSWFTYAFATFGIIALAAASTVYYKAQPGIKSTQEIVSLLSEDTQVKSVAPGSFGSLATVSLAGGGSGGGGGDAETNKVMTDIPEGVGGGSSEPMPVDMPPYVPVSYKFVYKGEDFSVPNGQMEVLERVKRANTTDAKSFLGKISFGLINIDKFQNQRLDNISIYEDQDFGYQFNANFREGSVSIHENWEKWPQYYGCFEGVCNNPEPLTLDKIPNDDALIQLAQAFLDNYGISTSQYGNPVVQDYWKQDYERSQKMGYQFYVPEVLGVIYPLELRGQKVYDESGYESGFVVNINIRENKVSGVYDIRSQSYNASAYDTETDTGRLVSLAERGGFRSYFPIYEEPGTKTEIVELGTPTISYARVWKYDNMKSQELFVPALIFPIIKNSETQPIYQKNIIIPLIKEILDAEAYNNPPIGIPFPKPMPEAIETIPAE